jgi:anion transporter
LRFGPGQLVALVAVLTAALLFAMPGWLGVRPGLGPPAAIVVLALAFWATSMLPVHVTALLIFVLMTVLQVAPPEVVFGGFAAAGLWLVFGGLVLAAGIEVTGLGRRFARPVVGWLGGSHRRVVYGTVGVTLALAFLVPAAMGRIVILVPIYRALLRELGYPADSSGAIGIMLAVTFGSFLPSFAILPANLPNMVLLGAMETIYQETISYGAYLALHFPVLGALKALLLAELICRLFPSEPRTARDGADAEVLGPWSPAERRLLAILVLALALWATDWLHGISPGWVALTAGLLCLLPGIGVLDGQAFQTRVNFSSFIYVAGLLGMVRLIDQSGLGDALGASLLGSLALTPGASFLNFAALVLIASGTSLVTALAGSPAVLTPLAAPLAEATGFPLISVLMVQVIGFSAMLLPYQAAPLLVGVQLAGVPLRRATRLSLPLGLLTLLVLAPLDFLWWRALGWLP